MCLYEIVMRVSVTSLNCWDVGEICPYEAHCDFFCPILLFWLNENLCLRMVVGYWITSWRLIKLIWIAIVFRIEINREELNLDMFMFYCLYWYSVYVKSNVKRMVRFVLFSNTSVHMRFVMPFNIGKEVICWDVAGIYLN